MGRTIFEIPILIHQLLPKGSDRGIAPIFAARAMRGFADGFVAVLLPVYLLEIGLGGVEVRACLRARRRNRRLRREPEMPLYEVRLARVARDK